MISESSKSNVKNMNSETNDIEKLLVEYGLVAKVGDRKNKNVVYNITDDGMDVYRFVCASLNKESMFGGPKVSIGTREMLFETGSETKVNDIITVIDGEPRLTEFGFKMIKTMIKMDGEKTERKDTGTKAEKFNKIMFGIVGGIQKVSNAGQKMDKMFNEKPKPKYRKPKSKKSKAKRYTKKYTKKAIPKKAKSSYATQADDFAKWSKL